MFSISIEKQIDILKVKIDDVEQNKKMPDNDKSQLLKFYKKKLRGLEVQASS